MRPKISGVKSVQWAAVPSGRTIAPAMSDRPAISAAPVSIEEGPVLGESVHHVGTWGWYSDRAKVAKLRKLAEDYGHDPRLRWWVVHHVLEPAGAQSRQWHTQLDALFRKAQSFMYTNESGEHLQSPWWTLKYRTGDCDDLALFLAACLTSLGFPFRYALAGQRRSDGAMVRWLEGDPLVPGVDYTHIYLFAGNQPFTATSWVAMEPTLSNVPLGYCVVEKGLPQGVVAQDMGSSPYAGIPSIYGEVSQPRMHDLNVDTMLDRSERLRAFRDLPPHEAFRAAGPWGFAKDWMDWSRISTAVIEGVITSSLIALVLAKANVHRGGRK